MEDMRLKYYVPVVTGTPRIGQTPNIQSVPEQKGEGTSFQAMLQQQLEAQSGVTFSKHAVKRAIEHQLDLTDEDMTRLNEGMRLASAKNLEDTLILVDNTAFVVNAKNNTVITAVGSSQMKGNVFTNISGTVIV